MALIKQFTVRLRQAGPPGIVISAAWSIDGESVAEAWLIHPEPLNGATETTLSFMGVNRDLSLEVLEEMALLDIERAIEAARVAAADGWAWDEIQLKLIEPPTVKALVSIAKYPGVFNISNTTYCQALREYLAPLARGHRLAVHQHDTFPPGRSR